MNVPVLLVALAVGVGICLLGRRRRGYSHLRQTISELGERGAPDGRLVSLGVFLPVGLVAAAVWHSQQASSPTAAMLAGAIAIGYCGAALFRCDPGSPLHGSFSQSVHNLAGGVQYIGGALALGRLGAQSGPAYYGLAAVVAVAIACLSFPPLFPWRGIAQRAGEVALVVGLASALSPAVR